MTAIPDGRSLPRTPRSGSEREMLLWFLRQQREACIAKVLGLDDEVARTTATASGLPMLGLINHLANVERSWIRDEWAGQPCTYDWSDEDRDGELKIAPGTTVASVVAGYVEEAALVDAVVLAAPDLEGLSAVELPSPVGGPPERFSLRWALIHLIEETARHAGHLDLLRESIDGQVGDPPLRPID